MDVWFSIEEQPPPRGAKASWRDLKTFVSAPPERVRRAFALLTRTYHGCRLFFTMVVVSETRKLSFDPFRRVTSLRNAGFFLTFTYFLVHLTLWITAFRVRELVYPERSRRAPAF